MKTMLGISSKSSCMKLKKKLAKEFLEFNDFIIFSSSFVVTYFYFILLVGFMR